MICLQGWQRDCSWFKVLQCQTNQPGIHHWSQVAVTAIEAEIQPVFAASLSAELTGNPNLKCQQHWADKNASSASDPPALHNLQNDPDQQLQPLPHATHATHFRPCLPIMPGCHIIQLHHGGFAIFIDTALLSSGRLRPWQKALVIKAVLTKPTCQDGGNGGGPWHGPLQSDLSDGGTWYLQIIAGPDGVRWPLLAGHHRSLYFIPNLSRVRKDRVHL